MHLTKFCARVFKERAQTQNSINVKQSAMETRGNSSELRGAGWLLRDKEMEACKGGYRETESGLDASFLWAHDKSGKDKGGRRGGGRLRE